MLENIFQLFSIFWYNIFKYFEINLTSGINIGQEICNQSAFNKIRRQHTGCRKLLQ